MGSALRLPIAAYHTGEEAIAAVRRHGCRVVAAVPRSGKSFFDADLDGALAVLIGGEGSGLGEALLKSVDGRITIPMKPPVESLNAAVTAALLAYEARRRRS
jgi:tRNA G18 (ribose-2'-O)-methylase SpoU